MMSAAELKQKITDQLLKIDDINFLNGMVNLLEHNSPNDFHELSAYQEKRIEEARKEALEANTCRMSKFKTMLLNGYSRNKVLLLFLTHFKAYSFSTLVFCFLFCFRFIFLQ